MSDRDIYIATALLELLADMGSTPLGERQAVQHMALKTAPRATPSEVQAALKWSESEGFAGSIRDPHRGLFYSITTAGRMWLQQNG